MRLRAILLALMIFILILPAPVMAAETGNGRVEGLVVNGTRSVGVADQDVILKIYLNNSEMDSKTGRTNARGQFIFEGLSTKPGYSYEVALKFQEADYNSERVSFGDGVTTKSVEITVYDSTTSAEAIKIDTAHTIVYVDQGGLLVKTYALVGNETLLTYIGSKQLAPDKRETLRFTLPKGAKESQYGLSLMECCVVPVEEGFSDTMPVLPGSKEVAYSYRISNDSGVYTLMQEFDYPADRFDLLVQGGGISVSGDKLTPEQPVTIEGKQFSRFSAQNLGAGDVLNIELSGLPEGGRQGSLRWLLLGLITLAFAATIVYLMRRKRVQPVPVRAENSLVREKQRLLVELARLDDNFEAGRIAEDDYRRQRAEKKRRLLRLMQISKEARE